MAHIQGVSLIGARRGEAGGPSFEVADRHSGQSLPPAFHCARPEETEAALRLSQQAFRSYAELAPEKRAAFLRQIADELEGLREEIVPRAMAESALPEARLAGELGRTTGQLRFFAGIIEEGAWLDARIDMAEPDRQPLPKPDLRSMLRPLGPVAVFGASNFPLAFSTAGGDTASALAAGCPVIVKGHPAHPGTAELAAQAILRAAERTDMPEGVFSFLVDNESTGVGETLVRDPRIQAVGFTGSKRVGLHLWRLANSRPVPIPVYAEMGSVNPVVVMPSVLSAQHEGFAKQLRASATVGGGQFCTNPGLVLLIGESQAFIQSYVQEMAAVPACTMLTEGIAGAYLEGAERLAQHSSVEALLAPSGKGAPSVYAVTASDLLQNLDLQEEVFGPLTLLVRCADLAEAEKTLLALEGQLTASLFGSEEEAAQAKDLIWAMERIAGRVIFNQFPTGLEVCQSVVHGGPFPATTDPRTTSVGGRAILRWTRPVAYQNFPLRLLPGPLAADPS
jgi:2,5-dioxopentanoate dehydrogenase